MPGPHTDVRSVLLDFKFVFDYGADPPENVETAIDVVNKITHLIGADLVRIWEAKRGA